MGFRLMWAAGPSCRWAATKLLGKRISRTFIEGRSKKRHNMTPINTEAAVAAASATVGDHTCRCALPPTTKNTALCAR